MQLKLLEVKMTNQELINVLKTCRQSDEVRFYFLEDNTLHGCVHETILNVDDQVEITIKKDNSDENGVEE